MGIDLDELRNKKARRSTDTWDPDPGDNKVRILPPSSAYFDEDIGDFAVSFRMHWFQQEGRDTEVSRCLRDRGDFCPACAMAQRYRDADDPGLADLADNVSRGRRFAFNILDMEGDGPAQGIQHYVGGKQVYDDVLDYAANPEWGDIFHPVEGRNVTITLTPANRSETGWNQYSATPSPEKTSVAEHLSEGWKDQLDALENAPPGYKNEEEIWTILERMGFPTDEHREGKA